MSDCDYFRSKKKVMRNRQIRSDRMSGDRTVVRHWCAHRLSTVPEDLVNTVGRVGHLRCGGDTERCQIDPRPEDL